MKRFCDECLKDVECKLKEENRKINIDGIDINYLEKYYICSECNSEFYDDLYDINIVNANNELRKKTNIITISEIEEIIKKYNIGKKPLSIVLGLGEITITRYLEGSNPTRENSELLKNVNKDPLFFEMYLNVNKDKIKDVAYRKALSKVKQLEMNNEKSKLYEAAIYIIRKTKDVTPLALQKILYFSQCFSNSLFKGSLFIDSCEAWVHGPVYRDVYDCFSCFKGNIIEYDQLFINHESLLSNEEKEYLDSIIRYFGCYSGGILREMSHLTDPWIIARNGLDEEEPSDRIIDYKDILEYGNTICEKYDIKEVSDLYKYSWDLFNKVNC